MKLQSNTSQILNSGASVQQWIQDFPEVGGGRQPIIQRNLPEKCMKINKIGVGRGKICVCRFTTAVHPVYFKRHLIKVILPKVFHDKYVNV